MDGREHDRAEGEKKERGIEREREREGRERESERERESVCEGREKKRGGERGVGWER